MARRTRARAALRCRQSIISSPLMRARRSRVTRFTSARSSALNSGAWTLLRFDDGVEGVSPSPGVDPGVAAGQVRLGDVEVEGRLPERLVPREDDLLGGVAVNRAEARPFTGEGVDAVEGAAAGAAGHEAESGFHAIELAGSQRKRTDSEP